MARFTHAHGSIMYMYSPCSRPAIFLTVKKFHDDMGPERTRVENEPEADFDIIMIAFLVPGSAKLIRNMPVEF